jgi:proline iminopeptidase
MHVEVNRTRLFVDVAGPMLAAEGDRLVERRVMLVLHGGPGFDQGYLRPGLDPLRDELQVVFVDLRGQGRSDPDDPAACTLEQMADDVAELCRALGIIDPIVFGHSAGGFVALHLALRHPGLCAALILCATTPALGLRLEDNGPTLPERAGPHVAASAERFFGGGFSPAEVDEFVATVMPYYSAPAHMDVPARLFGLSRANTDLMRHFFGSLASAYDVRPRLHEISVPVLVLVGADDWVCPPGASRLLAASLPDARLVVIAGAGHFAFSEEPDRFRAAVSEFLADTPA